MDEPIFVVGTPRSGTTLTAKILGRHSRIFMPGETHFFDDIYARQRSFGDLSQASTMARVIKRLSTLYGRYNEHHDQERIEQMFAEPSIVELMEQCRNYADLFSCFMNIQAKRAGKMRWGNNVPKDIFHLREILTFYPQAKILICIRDIRAFLLSYRNKWQATSVENSERLLRIYHPVLTCLLWKSSVRYIKTTRLLVHSRNLMIIPYETLVKDPEKTVRNICNVIEEIFEPDMLTIDTHNSSFEMQRQGIFSSSVDRWREYLTNEELYIAQRLAKREMLDFGYTLERITVNPMALLRIILRFPYALWNALDANKEMRGPLFPYLFRRIVSFLQ